MAVRKYEEIVRLNRRIAREIGVLTVMDCKKYVEIVKETQKSVIATIWTGANYYIDIFPKADLDDCVEYAACHKIFITREDAIRNYPVDGMLHLCRNEDFSKKLLNDMVDHLLKGEQAYA